MDWAARAARCLASSTLAPSATATPRRRPSCASGLPKSRASAPGTASASATPSNRAPWPGADAPGDLMTAEAPGERRAVSTGRPRSARACSSNSDSRWLAIVTMPVSCGRGETSENSTSWPQMNSSTPNTPQPPRASVIRPATSRARSSAAAGSACGCQDST